MSGVLHVCTANRCRSAMAERMMAAALPQVEVFSAGICAPLGRPMWPGAAAELTRRGLSSSGFGSAQLTPALVAHADLVLTATRAHRDAVLAEAPTALRKVFTWRELAWLLSQGDPQPGRLGAGRLDPAARVGRALAAVGAHAAQQRGRVPALEPRLLDVDDPVLARVPAESVVVAAEAIEEALVPISRLIATILLA